MLFRSDEKVPYSKSCQKYNTEKMLRMHSSTVNTNIFGKAESDTIKGLIAPPPAFPSKKVNVCRLTWALCQIDRLTKAASLTSDGC